MNGYIKLWRKILEWGWWCNSQTLHVFLYLLLNANFKESEFLGQTIKRGDCVVGRLKLATSLGLTEMQIRTCLIRLKSTSEITIKTTNRFSIITLCNYEKYNASDFEDNQQDNQQNNQQITNKQPTDNQQITTSEEVKKDRRDIYYDSRSEIIAYLNEKIKSHYRPNSEGTAEHINARLKAGFTVDDFKKVIDKKTAQWLCDEKMVKFLRPITLFSPEHFETYLNEPEKTIVSVRRILQ